MENLKVPTSRASQYARQRILNASTDFQNHLINFSDLLSVFFSESQSDPALQESSLFEEAMNFVNMGDKMKDLFEKELIFSNKLQQIPVVNEVDTPYILCNSPEERIDREIVLKLNEFCPELLEENYYQSNMEQPTCAHSCYPHLARRANKYIKNLSDQQMKENVISPLSKIFLFIETISKINHDYVENVIAVSFLEDLTEDKKEIWKKLLGPKTRDILRKLELHLKSIGFR